MPLASDITAPTEGTASNLMTQFVSGNQSQAIPYLTVGGRLERPEFSGGPGMNIAGGWKLRQHYGLRGSGEIQGLLDEATRNSLNQYILDRKAEGFTQVNNNTLKKDLGNGQSQTITINWNTGLYDLSTVFDPTQTSEYKQAQKTADRRSVTGALVVDNMKNLSEQFPGIPADLAHSVASVQTIRTIAGPKTIISNEASTKQKLADWASTQTSQGLIKLDSGTYAPSTGTFMTTGGAGYSVAPEKLKTLLESNSKAIDISTTSNVSSGSGRSSGGGGSSRSSGGSSSGYTGNAFNNIVSQNIPSSSGAKLSDYTGNLTNQLSNQLGLNKNTSSNSNTSQGFSSAFTQKTTSNPYSSYGSAYGVKIDSKSKSRKILSQRSNPFGIGKSWRL